MATLNFRNHSIEVETYNNQDFTAPVIKVVNSNSYWYHAHLANGEIVEFILEKVKDSFPFINCLLNFKGNSTHVLLEEEEFPNSEVISIKFGKWNIANFATGEVIKFRFFNYEDSIPFRDNFPLEKYLAAKVATDKVKTAIAEYHSTMRELGAQQCEYRGYDYSESWYIIPEIENYEWTDF